MTKTILIVDDSESIRELVSYVLNEAGYEIHIGIDGEDAQKYLDGRKIDLVITDLNMPKIDGIELIKVVRAHANYSFTPILLLTTESQATKKEMAKVAGATGWIVKPFVKEKLLAVVKKIIG
ncbi:MAG: response regulator [Cyclobacteriaceae bacterium]|nr:response regulator [Cyclobacteriaceae bacterium]